MASTLHTGARADVRCTDEWGHAYTFATPPTEVLTLFQCQALPAKPHDAWRLEPVHGNGVDTRTVQALPYQRAAVTQAMRVIVTEDAANRRTTATVLPKVTHALNELIAEVALSHGHDQNLLMAIVLVESRFNAKAVSPKGAIGLMQVMPATGARMGVRSPSHALFDPKTNLIAGARYLTLLKKLFPNRLDLVVAAYNAGEGAVLRYRRNIPPYRETQDYVRRVLESYHRYQNG
jgi:soluble lytic murein transglycosylase-like protein